MVAPGNDIEGWGSGQPRRCRSTTGRRRPAVDTLRPSLWLISVDFWRFRFCRRGGPMRTPICELLGIELPLLAFSHCRDVVAAVTNAGGFGVLGASLHTPERLDTELSWIEEQVGGRPYGVDLLLPPKYVGADEGGIDAQRVAALLPDEHRAFL